MVALLKYEFKSTCRTFLPIYGAMFALSFVIGISNSPGVMFESGELWLRIEFLVFFALAVAMMVLTLVVTIQRFHQNLLGGEGYLMFTLPVSTASLILSKLAVATLWFVLSSLCLGAGVLIIAGGWLNAWGTIDYMLDLINPLFIKNAPLYIAEYALSALVQSAATVLMIYASISVGHLASKRRSLTAFFAFIAFLVAQSTISALVAGSLLDRFFPGGIPSVFGAYDPSRYDAYQNLSALVGIGISAVYCFVYFSITNHILKSRLNLE